MLILTEEKKRTMCALGTAYAAYRIRYPAFEGKEKLNAFYASLAENLIEFFVREAENVRNEHASLPRREKMNFSPLLADFFFAVAYDEGDTLSIICELIVRRGKNIIQYYRSAQAWDTCAEILIHPKKLFLGKAARLASANEFYFDGEAVVIENLFPRAEGATPRRKTLADYVRITRFEQKPR
jgi:hypothetical protein